MILRKNKLQRVPQSLISRYFDGEDVYIPIAYDFKSGFFVFDDSAVCSKMDRNYVAHNALEFLQSDRESNGYLLFNEIKVLLRKLGIHEESHYKVEISSNHRRNEVKDYYVFIWNDEFVMKYAD